MIRMGSLCFPEQIDFVVESSHDWATQEELITTSIHNRIFEKRVGRPGQGLNPENFFVVRDCNYKSPIFSGFHVLPGVIKVPYFQSHRAAASLYP